jgi:predicted Fe-S protein YdhL (DUF1289 family)
MNKRIWSGRKSHGKQDHNPCVRNCCLDDKKICIGCGRSLPEILEWHDADPKRQQAIKLSSQQRLSERSHRLQSYQSLLTATPVGLVAGQ